jgi:methionyl aminopeptidase
MTPEETQKILKAGNIAKQVREYAKSIIKKDKPLLEIAEAIEEKIIELGGKPAFPTNLSIDDIAAHYTPSYNDENTARGLLKVDFGVHINGFPSDTAFSIDLENSEENKKLIIAAEDALNSAALVIKKGTKTNKIGKAIQQTIESHGFSPIINLSGHSMENYELHAGITIPNIDDRREIEITEGLYAIEPFATSGNGKVYDGKPSGIYQLAEIKPIRNPTAREVLEYIGDEYETLPFCSRWIIKKFGVKSLIALKQLEEAGILHQFDQLVEISHKPVAQAEHTFLITDKTEITT